MRQSILKTLANTSTPQIMDASVVYSEVIRMETDGLCSLVYGEGYVITDKGREAWHGA